MVDAKSVTIPQTLAQGLVHFQASVPAIDKTHEAKIPTKAGGSYSYKYADLADIWAAIRKPLSAAGLAVTQGLTDGADSVTRLITKIWHESGETETYILDIPTGGKTPQEAGSLFTYYKRYALSAALGISTEDDDDGQRVNIAPERTASKAVAKKEPVDRAQAVIRRIKALNLTDEAAANIVKAHGKVDRLADAKPWNLKDIETALDRIEAGDEQLPLDWFKTADGEVA